MGFQAMNVRHQELAQGRWVRMPLAEQLANIGSEVSRSLNWRRKGNNEYAEKAMVRALKLLDLSLESTKAFPTLKELARLREALVDYFYGANEFGSSETLWRKYFDYFAYLARQGRD